MCYPEGFNPAAPTGEQCDTQSFSFWQNALLPHWNFIPDHYNRGTKDQLGPYNFTTYWNEDRDADWYKKYNGVVFSDV